MRVYKDAYMAVADRLKRQVERGLSTRHAEALLRDIQEIVRQLDEYTYDWLEAEACRWLMRLGLSPRFKTGSIRTTKHRFGGFTMEAVRAIVQDAFPERGRGN